MNMFWLVLVLLVLVVGFWFYYLVSKAQPPDIARLVGKRDTRSLIRALSWSTKREAGWQYIEQTRTNAAIGLGQVCDEQAIPALLESTTYGNGMGVDSQTYRVIVVQAVSSILNYSTRQTLSRAYDRGEASEVAAILQQVHSFRKDIERILQTDINYEEPRRALLEFYAVCASLGDKEAIGRLEGYLTGDKALAESAAALLDQLQLVPKSDSKRLAFLIAKRDYVGIAAFGEEAVEPLCKLLWNTDSETEKRILDALAKIGEEAIISGLLTLLGRAAVGSQKEKQILDALAKKGEEAIRRGFFQLLASIKWSLESMEYAVQIAGGTQAFADEWSVHQLLSNLHRRLPEDFTMSVDLTQYEVADFIVKMLVRIAQIDPRLISDNLSLDDPSQNVGAALILKQAEWQPTDDKAGVLYLEATDRCSEITSLGKGVLTALLKIIRRSQGARMVDALQGFDDPRIAPVLLKTLKTRLSSGSWKGNESLFHAFGQHGQIGDIREMIIDSILEHPGGFDQSVVPNLFGVFTEPISLMARLYNRTVVDEYMGATDNDGYRWEYGYDTEPLEKAVEFLCASSNPVATNLLHKVASFPQMEVSRGESDQGYMGTCKLDGVVEARERARKELMRRGNPPYDPKAYRVDANFDPDVNR
jgi:hypothetical protein